jgi:hypothetical protein
MSWNSGPCLDGPASEATCLLCQPPAVIGAGILEHLLTVHPEQYGDGPETWPDGGLAVTDLTLEPDDFNDPPDRSTP